MPVPGLTGDQIAGLAMLLGFIAFTIYFALWAIITTNNKPRNRRPTP